MSARCDSALPEQRLPPAATRRCAILPFSVAKETGVRLHPAHTPCRWHEHQFSSEWWMDRQMHQTAETVRLAMQHLTTHY
jgi:hypothetical protein